MNREKFFLPRTIAWILLLTAAPAFPVFSDDPHPASVSSGLRYWFTGALGEYRGNGVDKPLSLMLNACYQPGPWLGSLRLLYGFHLPGNRDEMMEIALSAGRSISVGIFSASAAAGVGVVRGKEGEKRFVRMGIPSELQFSVQPFPFLGVVLYVYAHLGEHSFWGSCLGIKIGKVR